MSWSTFWVTNILAALLTFGCVRLWWSARPGTDEFATSIHTIKQATVGVIVDCRTPAESYPDEQLDFWQTEIDRILKQFPMDAELHAAAAVVLSEHCRLYFSQELQKNLGQSRANWEVAFNPFQHLAELSTRYDREGKASAQRLIRRANELAPSDPRWWRLRAVLLLDSPLAVFESSFFDDGSIQVLHAAREHDANNALYDIVEASQFRDHILKFDDDGTLLGIDRRSWNRTVELAEQATACEHVSFGEPALQGIVRLHAIARHPTATTLESIRSRFIATRCSWRITSLVRSLMHMADTRDDSVTTTERFHLLDLAEQLNDLASERADVAYRYDGYASSMQKSILGARVRLEEKVGLDSGQTIRALDDATEHWNDYVAAAETFAQERAASDRGRIAAAASATVLPLFACFLGLSLLCLGLLRILRRGTLQLSVWPAVLLLAAVGISFFFLGAGAAIAVSDNMQNWVFTCLIFASVLSLIAGVVARSKLRFRFRIRSLLIAITVIAVLLQIAFQLRIGWSSLGLPIRIRDDMEFPFGFNIASLITQTQQQQFLPGPTWISDSVLKWLMNDGPFWSVAIFLGLMLTSLIWRKSVLEAIRQFCVACLLCCLVFGNARVWIEPENYLSARPTQMSYETYIRSPNEYYQRVEELMEQELATRQNDAEPQSLRSADGNGRG